MLIISYVLITLMCDSGRYFKEKLKSLLGVRELNLFLDSQVNNYVTLSLTKDFEKRKRKDKRNSKREEGWIH